MEQYFRLNADCLLVEGIRDCALYDVGGCRLFVLDEPAYRLLRGCEDNRPLNMDGLTPAEREVLRWLSAEGLGNFEGVPLYIDKYSVHTPIAVWSEGEVSSPCRQLDVSITNECSVGCSFCPSHSETATAQRCLTCLRQADATHAGEFLSELDQLVDQASAVGFGKFHLRGGDPLLEWDRVMTVVQAAERHPHLLVAVTTPGGGPPIGDIVRLGSHPQVYLNIVVVNPDALGTHPDAEPLPLIRELKEHRVRFLVTILLTGTYARHRHSLEDWMCKITGRKPQIAELRDSCSDEVGVPFPTMSALGKTLTPWKSADALYERSHRCVCLSGRLQINYDGGVQACAGLPTRHDTMDGCNLLSTMNDESIYAMWERSGTSVASCERCALRYACLDCRSVTAVESEISFCPFDPDGTIRAVDAPWQHDGFVYRLRASEGAGNPVCLRA